jgi:MurNAc alpha-1-phosphate uridylyltransferase
MKAMILAAGKGTRMLPLTETMPKVLIEVHGIPLLEHTIRYLKYYGIDEIIVNVHHHAEQIKSFIKKKGSFDIRIEFSEEINEPLNTGGGLYKARWFFDDNEPFVLTSSDVITNLNLSDLISFHKKIDPLATLAVKERKSSRDFIFDQEYHLCGWHSHITGETRLIKEVQNPLHLGFSTIHCINPAIFNLIIEQGPFSIVDTYLRLAASHHLIMGFEHNSSAWFECGRIENYSQLNHMPEIQAIYHEYHQGNLL